MHASVLQMLSQLSESRLKTTIIWKNAKEESDSGVQAAHYQQVIFTRQFLDPSIWFLRYGCQKQAGVKVAKTRIQKCNPEFEE